MGHKTHGCAIDLYGLNEKQALFSKHTKEIIPNRQFCIWQQAEDPISKPATGDDIGELPLVIDRYFADLDFEAPHISGVLQQCVRAVECPIETAEAAFSNPKIKEFLSKALDGADILVCLVDISDLDTNEDFKETRFAGLLR